MVLFEAAKFAAVLMAQVCPCLCYKKLGSRLRAETHPFPKERDCTTLRVPFPLEVYEIQDSLGDRRGLQV